MVFLGLSLFVFVTFNEIIAEVNVTTFEANKKYDITSATTLSVGDIWSTRNSSIVTVTETAATIDNDDGNSSCVKICSRECYTRETTVHERPRKHGDKIPLYISAFYAGRFSSWDGSGIVPAAEMAFDDFNAKTDVLPQYILRPIWNETKCDDPGTGSRALFDQLFREPTKLIILGPACSPSAQAIASTAHYWNLITFSYGAESIGLSNRKSYPYFYRSVSSAMAYGYARLRLLKKFGWKRVAIIHNNQDVHKLKKDAKIIVVNTYEDEARKIFCEAYKQGMTGKGYVWLIYGFYHHKFWDPVDDTDIDCTVDEMEQVVQGSISTEIQMLNGPTVVTIANMTSTEYESRLKARLQRPDDFNTYGAPAYDAVWAIGLMLHKAALELAERNRSKRLEDFTYDDSEMMELFFRLLADTQFEGVSGPVSFINGDRSGAILLEQIKIGCLEGWNRHANDCYTFIESPSTWIEAAGECVTNGGHLATLKEPDDVAFLESRWPERSQSLLWIGLQRHHQMEWMWGIDSIEVPIWIPPGSSLTGPSDLQCVAMNKDGTWQAMNCNTSLPYICKAHAKMALHIIGYHNIRTDDLRLISNFTWKDNEIPLDHTPEIVITYKRVQNGISSHIYFTMCALAASGGVLALAFLVFNSKFRKQKYVKMSSPNLNNIIIAGSVLVYGWVAVSGIDNTLVSDRVFSLFCQIRMWLLSVGFVLSFGAMFSKTWRVYRVATFNKPRRVVITDQQLLILIGILLMFDLAILTLWQVISPWYIATEQGYEIDDPNVENQKLLPYVDYCTCSWITYWLIALCGFKGLLLIFGMFLAWETRKVEISALNDSKLIGISVYNVVILCTIGGAISLIIEDPSTLYLFTASIVLFCTTLTLCTIFVPKVISVYKYPEGQSVSTMKTTSSAASLSLSQSSVEMSNLKNRIVQLEDALRKANGYAKTDDVNVTLATVISQSDE